MNRVEYEKQVIQDIINDNDRGELKVDPWYQRRSVWSTTQQAYLINSIFEKMPIPTIYIRHYLDIEKEKSIKEIVDGQQRIRAILDYVDNVYAAKHPNHKRRVKYSELTKSEKEDFRMTPISIGYLISADLSDVIEIFGRLNSVSKTLNAQEKRNAKFSGEYKQFSLKQAAQRVNLLHDLNIFSAYEISRMLEVQFVSDLVLNLVKGLSDYSASALDKIYKEYDEEFPQQSEIVGRMDAILSKIASLNPSAIRDTIFSRQPIFFSLFLVLDRFPHSLKQEIEKAISDIDSIYNTSIPISEHKKRDAEFITACTASTQRIKSRKIRDEYIASFLSNH